jgi:hypothetical protein
MKKTLASLFVTLVTEEINIELFLDEFKNDFFLSYSSLQEFNDEIQEEILDELDRSTCPQVSYAAMLALVALERFCKKPLHDL